MSKEVLKMKKQIEKIPDDGWWDKSNCDEFKKIAVKLYNKSISREQVVEILSDTYRIVSDEYGS